MTKVVFFGTPEYVVPVVEALEQKHDIVAVVTQPPKPIGRKRRLTPSPVWEWAERKDIKVVTDLKDLSDIKADLGVLAAYGEIIPKDVLEIFSFGVLNIHPSLLPKWRGAAPVEAAIVSGESETGVTVIKLDEEMDHGKIVAQDTGFKIQRIETAGTLKERLFKEGARLLVDILPDYLAGKVKLREQEHGKATYTRPLTKQDGFIPSKYINAVLQGETLEAAWEILFVKDYSLLPTACCLERFIRAMTPWPGSWTLLRLKATGGQAKTLKILKAHVDGEKLVLDQVQLEGKKPVRWKQFVEGYPDFKL